MNRLLCGDAAYAIDELYRAGARAMRDGVPASENPHRYGSRAHRQWADGHRMESLREHIRFGVDVLAVPAGQDTSFGPDPLVPRDDDGLVNSHWHAATLASASGLQAVPDFMRQWNLVLAENADEVRAKRYSISLSGHPLDTRFSTLESALSWVGRNRKQLRHRSAEALERLLK